MALCRDDTYTNLPTYLHALMHMLHPHTPTPTHSHTHMHMHTHTSVANPHAQLFPSHSTTSTLSPPRHAQPSPTFRPHFWTEENNGLSGPMMGSLLLRFFPLERGSRPATSQQPAYPQVIGCAGRACVRTWQKTGLDGTNQCVQEDDQDHNHFEGRSVADPAIPSPLWVG